MRLDTWVNSAKGRVAADLCKQAFNIENGFFFFFLARPSSMQDLSSPTRN